MVVKMKQAGEIQISAISDKRISSDVIQVYNHTHHHVRVRSIFLT